MQIIKYAWLCLALAVLSLNIFSYVSNPNGDATGNIMFLLGILGFPLSVIPTLLTLILVGYAIPEASNPFIFAGVCLAYCIAGLIQWFWLVPKMFNHYRNLS